jgi:hypothetical protein
MESETAPAPAITLGPVRLQQQPDGSLLCWHKALTMPVTVDDKQLQRWLVKQLREVVVA